MATILKNNIDRVNNNLRAEQTMKDEQAKKSARELRKEERLARKQAEIEKKQKEEYDTMIRKLIDNYHGFYDNAERQFELNEFKAIGTRILLQFMENGGKDFVDKQTVMMTGENDVLSGRFIHGLSFAHDHFGGIRGDQNVTFYFCSQVSENSDDIELFLYRDDGKIMVDDGDHYPDEREAKRYTPAHLVFSSNGDIKHAGICRCIDTLDYNYPDHGGFYEPSSYTRVLKPLIQKVDAVVKAREEDSGGRGAGGKGSGESGEAQPE